MFRPDNNKLLDNDDLDAALAKEHMLVPDCVTDTILKTKGLALDKRMVRMTTKIFENSLYQWAAEAQQIAANKDEEKHTLDYNDVVQLLERFNLDTPVAPLYHRRGPEVREPEPPIEVPEPPIEVPDASSPEISEPEDEVMQLLDDSEVVLVDDEALEDDTLIVELDVEEDEQEREANDNQGISEEIIPCPTSVDSDNTMPFDEEASALMQLMLKDDLNYDQRKKRLAEELPNMNDEQIAAEIQRRYNELAANISWPFLQIDKPITSDAMNQKTEMKPAGGDNSDKPSLEAVEPTTSDAMDQETEMQQEEGDDLDKTLVSENETITSEAMDLETEFEPTNADDLKSDYYRLFSHESQVAITPETENVDQEMELQQTEEHGSEILRSLSPDNESTITETVDQERELDTIEDDDSENLRSLSPDDNESTITETVDQERELNTIEDDDSENLHSLSPDDNESTITETVDQEREMNTIEDDDSEKNSHDTILEVALDLEEEQMGAVGFNPRYFQNP